MVATTTAAVATTTSSKKILTNIHKEQTYAHARAKVWRALTEPALMNRWLMIPEGFAPEVGTKFVLRASTPQKRWRGFVECEVLAVEHERLIAYSWVGDPNVPPMKVTFRLVDDGAGGTRLTLDHEGFAGVGGFFLAKLILGPGWAKMLRTRLADVIGGLA